MTDVSPSCILQFYGQRCEPCRLIAPLLMQEASKFPAIPVQPIDIDAPASQAVCARYEVTAVPTLVFLLRGEELCRAVGNDPGRVLACCAEFRRRTYFPKDDSETTVVLPTSNDATVDCRSGLCRKRRD